MPEWFQPVVHPEGNHDAQRNRQPLETCIHAIKSYVSQDSADKEPQSPLCVPASVISSSDMSPVRKGDFTLVERDVGLRSVSHADSVVRYAQKTN